MATLGGQTCNLSKKPQLLAKSTTNACSAIWWPKLELNASENWNRRKSWKEVQKKLKNSWEKVEKSRRRKVENFCDFV